MRGDPARTNGVGVMQVEGAVAVVTGANRGLGAVFAEQLLVRGAAKVYAAARDPESVRVPGVVALRLDVTDPASVAAAAHAAPDVTLVIGNAGVDSHVGLVTGDLDLVRRDMDVNFWGALHVVRAFAPVLAGNGGGALLQVLSALSWFGFPGEGGYAASKAAAWGMVNNVRLELAGQGTLVTAVHLGAADTDMTAAYDGPKLSPLEVVTAALDGLVAGRPEVLVDDWSRMVKASLSGDPLDVTAQG